RPYGGAPGHPSSIVSAATQRARSRSTELARRVRKLAVEIRENGLKASTTSTGVTSRSTGN
ncbi:hypothetical protein, partial [Rhodobium orientis]|uniref:hypothetical protein n=1 Tax=Rhodobium orientis TaxID=34017 RepID=UPI001AECA1D3